MKLKIEKKKGPLILITVALLLFMWYLFLSPLPSMKKFLKKEYSVQVYDCKNRLLYVKSTESGAKNEYTRLSDIPRPLIKAFIKAEDKRFYFHPGFDLPSIVRAASQNKKAGRTVSGASTITMQLARIIKPSEERTILSKIKELDRTVKIEARLSKRKILELYLNSLPFGNNTEGVTSAARFYFSKDLSELSEEECMLLSIIPRRPKTYDPEVNPEICAEKASEIFKKDKKILLEAALNSKRYSWPFYCEHLVQKVLSENKNHERKIFLTVDRDLQNFATFSLNEALRKNSENSRIHNASLLVLENETGNILCWIGNADWYDKKNAGEIDGVLVKNQMGSSMKPFLYAAALENGKKSEKGTKGFTGTQFSPYQILNDIPMEFGGENIYLPKNFNNKTTGPVLMRTALASSLNIPAVYLLSKITPPHYLNVLEDLGFSSLKEDGLRYGLGLSLGAGEVTLFELTRSFSVFANDGILYDYTYLQNNQKSNKKHKKAPKSSQSFPRKVFEKDTARIIADFLSDKNARSRGFGLTQTFQTTYPSIFKTGTANQFQNIVALGGTKEYTVGVWMGNFSGNTVVGKTGSSLPAKIAREILDFLNGDKYIPFPEPENYEKIPICPLSGLYPCPDCPTTLTEYAEKSRLTEIKNNKCFWHKKVIDSNNIEKTITIYPSEYQNWLGHNRTESFIDYSSSPLKIVTPRDNSIFFHSKLEGEKQTIPVSVIGGGRTNNHGHQIEEKLLVLYDGKPLFEEDEISRPFNFFLPVETGHHHLKVILEDEEDEIRFTVK